MKNKIARMLAWALPTLSMVFFGVQPCSAGTPPINTRITVISDFDGDGSVDPIRREVRTHETDFVVGRIIIERGSDGTVLAEFASPEPGDYFGWSVMAMPDLNNDGLPEIAVAAPGALIDAGGPDGAGARLGRVHLISPARGVELWSSPAPIFADHAFMYAHAQTLARCGDINADGYPDIVIGVSRYSIIDQDPLAGNNNASTAPALPAPLWVAVSGRDGTHLAIDESSIFNTGLPNLDTLQLEASNDLEAWRLFQAHGRRLLLEGVPGDLTGDGVVDEADLSSLLRALAAEDRALNASALKQAQPHISRFDLDHDGTLGAGDLASLLATIGAEALDSQAISADRGGEPNNSRRRKLPPVDCACEYHDDGPTDENNTPFEGDGDGPGGGGPDGGPPAGCTGACCTDPCACSTAGCNPACGGNPCSPGCSNSACNPACGGDPCSPSCSSSGCNPLCDSDNDGENNGGDCDSPCYTGPNPAPNPPCKCRDDDEDGVRNDQDCDSGCYAPAPTYRGEATPLDCESCNCASFTPTGPAYVPIGADNVEYTLGDCDLQDVRWEFSPESLVEEGIPNGSSIRFRTGMEPGTLTVTAKFRLNGKDCESTASVRIVEYLPLAVRYTAYIPCSIIMSPPPIEGFFGGDARGTSTASTRYRVGYHLEFNVTEPLVLGDGTWHTATNTGGYPEFGLSRQYDPACGTATPSGSYCSSMLVLGCPAPQTLLHPPGEESYRLTYRSDESGYATVKAWSMATNPFVPFAPPIKIDMTFEFFQSINDDDGKQTVEVGMYGTRSQYPAHEAYVIPSQRPAVTLHSFTPAAGVGPEALIHPVQFIQISTVISLD